MNIFIYSLVIFVLAYLVLKLLARMNTKRLSKIVRSFIVIFSLILAILFALGGKFLLSFPLILISLGILKLKGLTLFQLFNLYRLIRVLQSSGRFSFNKFNQTQSTSGISLDEAYNILNLDSQKKYSKNEVMKSYKKIMRKIHPDISPELTRLASIVNEAKDIVIKDIS